MVDLVPVLPLVSGVVPTSGAVSPATREDLRDTADVAVEAAGFFFFVAATASSLGANKKYAAISTATMAVV